MLVWDGNRTEGDLDAAVAAAKAQNVPIDVMPLKYQVRNETFIERFVAPTWRREKEPFSLDVILNNTANFPTRGTLRIEQEGRPLDLDPTQPGVQSGRAVVLQPGRNRESITVDPIEGVDVRRFKAVWEPDRAGGKPVGDTLASNNVANAFTFVRGKGKVLYINNEADGGDDLLRAALGREGITVDANRTTVDAFPTSLVELQGYDAVILANVARGAGGLSDPQQRILAQYVHDTGGGLVMIGGPDTLGAGGWQGSELETVLPVDMDVPAKRQVPKGALALLMHSTEMANGNYWGEQCALKAVEVLNRRDDIGVLSYSFGAGGAAWDFPLQPKGDGGRVYSAIKNMQLGDMPDFDDALDLALNGDANSIGLKNSDARQKHVIIISDMDPAAPSPALVQAYKDARRQHQHRAVLRPRPGAAAGGQNARQADRRAGLRADREQPQPAAADLHQGGDGRPPQPHQGGPRRPGRDQDARRRRQPAHGGHPRRAAGDGVRADEQEGQPAGRGAAGGGERARPAVRGVADGPGQERGVDQRRRHAVGERASPAGSDYQKFWAQAVRGVSRAAQSGDYDVQTTVENGRGKIVVEAFGEGAKFKNNQTISGLALGEGGQDGQPVRLVQTKPGTYVGEFDARKEGNYVVALNAVDPEGTAVALRGGTAVNGSEEMKDLRDNEAAVRRVAEETGGRVIPAFGVGPGNDLFAVDYTDATGQSRTLARSYSPLPIWDWLIPVLLGLILLDVAIRRIAWDWEATKAVAAKGRGAGAGRHGHDARGRGGQARRRGDAGRLAADDANRSPPASASRRRRWRGRTRRASSTPAATCRRASLSDVIGGATDKPVPKGPAGKVTPKGQQGDKPGTGGGGMSDLMEAKRRARERMRDQE